MENEVWKPVLGFESDYEVSNFGRVRSIKKNKVTLLKGSFHTKKYLQVYLRSQGVGVTRRIHTLVLEAFIGPRPKNMEACHCDGNRQNNNLDNLRWDTQLNNHLDKEKHGRLLFGSKHPNAKLKEKDVMKIKLLLIKNEKIGQIAKMFNVTPATIKDIKTGKQWRRVRLQIGLG